MRVDLMTGGFRTYGELAAETTAERVMLVRAAQSEFIEKDKLFLDLFDPTRIKVRCWVSEPPKSQHIDAKTLAQIDNTP